jgi:hypothetical protein
VTANNPKAVSASNLRNLLRGRLEQIPFSRDHLTRAQKKNVEVSRPRSTDLERLKRWPVCISGDSFQILRHTPVGTMVEWAERGTNQPPWLSRHQ